MEQGCPHRSILPHIFPDCNSLAIKIGGKFCGVRGVPRWGGLPRRCRRGGRQRYPAGGLPALPPANPAFGLISCPLPRRGRIDPRPPSRREGGDFLFSYARGFAPCIPGAEPGRHWFAPPLWKAQWGACPGVAGAAGVSSTRRGACLLCRLLTLPLDFFSAPIPPAPFPGGEGGDFLFSYARGFAPCIPGAEPGRHWLSPPRGRGPSQTPKFLSPGPPSPWLPALPVGMHFRCFCTEPQAPCRRVPVWRKL